MTREVTMPLIGRGDFPDGFVFGTSTAAYQIEGSASGGAGLCHWDTFAATPGNVVRAENGAVACDHYNRWREDLDLAAGTNADAYRFSVNWARILPDGTGTVNDKGLDFYDRLVDGMLARGLQPWLTLYHWDLPSALAVKGGWMNRDIASWFTDFARIVMARIGDRIHATATINEPWCVAWLSHFLGLHAPGLRDIRAAGHTMHHVLFAHGQAMTALRADGFDNLGIVLNFEEALPASDNTADQKAAARAEAIYNRWFIEAVTRGTYPEEAMEGLSPHLPDIWQSDMPVISAPVDWLGVNYYTRAIVADDPAAPWPATRNMPGQLEKTAIGWEIWPEGLERILTWLARDLVGNLPVYVTENGIALRDSAKNGRVDDSARISYHARHLSAARRALRAGVNLKGYFFWSLLDNFEWAEGYDMRFGLVHVDFESLKRTPKASYHAIAEALSR